MFNSIFEILVCCMFSDSILRQESLAAHAVVTRDKTTRFKCCSWLKAGCEVDFVVGQ